jgi:serine/threonine-protein kinase
MGDLNHPEGGPSHLGRTLNRKYQLNRLLGSGAFGDVYEAVHLTTGRRVAVKTLHAHLLGHSGAVRRFTAEARASAQVAHDNVVEVFDFDVDPEVGVPYIVQELLTGETLEARLAASPGRRLPPGEALQLAVPVMGALVAAHARGVVHRDLKPANLFLARNRSGAEVPKVIDFGIAKFISGFLGEGGTKTGALLGSPAYMSPEQASGMVAEVDAQTDVWAIGVVLYEMLSGRLPYEAATHQRILGMIQYEVPVPLLERDPQLPLDLVAVIDRALTRDRATRYKTMRAFLGDLLETNSWAASSHPVAPVSRPPITVNPPEPTAVKATPVRSFAEPNETLRGGWSRASRFPAGSRERWTIAIAATLLVGFTGALVATFALRLWPASPPKAPTASRPTPTAALQAVAPTPPPAGRANTPSEPQPTPPSLAHTTATRQPPPPPRHGPRRPSRTTRGSRALQLGSENEWGHR